MSVHVDLVRNQWLTGEQQPIARLYVGQGKLQIDSPDRARWSPVVEEALGGVDLDQPADEVLEAAPAAIQGSHLFATEPHDEASCPFRDWSTVKMHSVSSQPATAGATSR